MTMLGSDKRTLFVGQAVKYPGQRAFPTFANVPMSKRIELPVAENFQMGFSMGLALAGYLPVSFYPRMDFLIIAADQLVNHLDKHPMRPKVIIRTAIGGTKPLNPGPQHTQDHTQALRLMLKTVRVMEIRNPKYVLDAYREAMETPESVIMVERMELY
jgi:pyruvate/2-oxoglutarate/acetoin dehydrogenase E1 component